MGYDSNTLHMLVFAGVIIFGLGISVVYYFARYYFKIHEDDKEVFGSLKNEGQNKGPKPEKTFKTIEEALRGTREGFWGRIRDQFSDKEKLAPSDVEALEELLFTSDLGPTTAQRLLEKVGDRLSSESSATLGDVQAFLKEEIESIFSSLPRTGYDLFSELSDQLSQSRPVVWMVVGVNGVGKTTTIGKLASKAAQNGLKVLIVAGDTFRAAADSQLRVWAERSQSEYFSAESTKDPAAVAYQALEKAKSQGVDLVIVDTAGRLHTQTNLMDELRKVKRVMSKVIPEAPHETLLVIDANNGQNALEQGRMFHQALEVSGVAITKMDGTSKGGVAVGLVNELALPIRFIGVGEAVEDLRSFNPKEFVSSMIG